MRLRLIHQILPGMGLNVTGGSNLREMPAIALSSELEGKVESSQSHLCSFAGPMLLPD